LAPLGDHLVHRRPAPAKPFAAEPRADAEATVTTTAATGHRCRYQADRSTTDAESDGCASFGPSPAKAAFAIVVDTFS
jgi:hypothetical protein